VRHLRPPGLREGGLELPGPGRRARVDALDRDTRRVHRPPVEAGVPPLLASGRLGERAAPAAGAGPRPPGRRGRGVATVGGRTGPATVGTMIPEGSAMTYDEKVAVFKA